MCVLHRFLRVFAICFGGLHCAPECTAYFYRSVLHLVFAGTYCSPWHGTNRKWEGGSGPPPLFFWTYCFFLVGFVGPVFGYFRDACTLSIFGCLVPVSFGWSVFIPCMFFMTWSALLFGKSSVQCIDHGYVLGVNFIPYCMYSSHFWSRVFTFFVIFECMGLHWLAKYDCTTLFMILYCKFVYFRTALTYSAFAFFFIPRRNA